MRGGGCLYIGVSLCLAPSELQQKCGCIPGELLSRS